MSILSADFERGINGNDILVADAGSASAWDERVVTGGTVKYSTTQKAHGGLAAQFDHSASTVSKYLGWTTSLGTVSDHYGRFYLFATAIPTTNSDMVTANTAGVSNNAKIRLTTLGNLQILPKTGTINTTTSVVPTNQWVRIEYHFIHSATVGQIEIRYFASMDSTTPTETLTSTANLDTDVSANELTFGSLTTGGAWIQYIDDIIANATSYPGPVVTVTGGGPGGGGLPENPPALWNAPQHPAFPDAPPPDLWNKASG